MNNAIWSNIAGASIDYHIKQKKVRKRQVPYDITCTWNLNYNTNEYTMTITDSPGLQKNQTGLPRWGMEEGEELGVWKQPCKASYIELRKQGPPA